MDQETLEQAANTFTLWGDFVASGITFDPEDVAELLTQVKTAVSADALPAGPNQMRDHLQGALRGDLHAAREFAETLNGYVTIAVRLESDGDHSVMIVDDETDITSLHRASNECDAFVAASLHHMGARIRHLARDQEPEVVQDEPEM